MEEGAEDSDLRDLRDQERAWMEIHRELVCRRLDTTPQHTLCPSPTLWNPLGLFFQSY